jgi:large subunit ribosomal protein L29
MTVKEMRELPDEELQEEILKTNEKVFKMRFQGKGKDVENPSQLKVCRRDIARMRTVMRQRALAAERGQQ